MCGGDPDARGPEEGELLAPRLVRPEVRARAFRVHLAADGSGMPVAASEVDAMADAALFVAPHGHAFALPASGFPAIRGGCVYHIVCNFQTKIATDVVITPLQSGACRHERGSELRLAGQWVPLGWLCPRGPVLETKLANS
ncbi:hypothetical protein ACP4OV_004105 [Aristida adscensionis]